MKGMKNMIKGEELYKLQQVKTYEVIRCGLIGSMYPGAVNLDLRLTGSNLHICFDIDQKYLPLGIKSGDILFTYHLRYILQAIEKDVPYNAALQMRILPAPDAKWEMTREFGEYDFFRCSACKKWNDKNSEYCPHCGANMILK